MRRIHLIWIGLLPLLIASTAFLTLAQAAPVTQGPGNPDASDCETGLQKWADPNTVYVGDQTGVTGIMTGTCPASALPVDIILLVDTSNSMTKGQPGSDISTPNPGVPTRDSNIATLPPIVPGPGTEPPKRPTNDPGPVPTDAAPEGVTGIIRQKGLAQIVPPPTEPTKRSTPGGEATPTPKVEPTNPGNIDQPTSSVIRRDETEPAGDEDLIREVTNAIRDFLDEVEPDVADGKIRLGLAAFNDRGHQYVKLTDDVGRVRSRLSRLRGQGNTRVDLGLSTATRMLVGVDVRGREDLDHKKMIVLFSDGKYDRRISARLRTRDNLDIITVAAGRGADMQSLRQIATESHFALDMRDRKRLVDTVRAVPPEQRSVTMDTLTIEDTLAVNMELVPGSVIPAPDRVVDGRTLQWDFAPPAFPITLTYRVKPQEVGKHKVSELAHAVWTDSRARGGDVPFPDVEIDVLQQPTPTFTATATETPIGPTHTPEPTPTREPQGPLYLPVVMNEEEEECIPSQQNVDIALIVDTSMSMGDPTSDGGVKKLDAAIAAMKDFVSMLKANDQAALTYFNADSTLLAQLTTDSGVLTRALSGLWSTQGPGTRINLGLQTALAELTSTRHNATSNRAVILVTDGRQDEIVGRGAVLDAAAQLKAQGIRVYCVGIGSDVDADLLMQVASSADTFYHSPDAESLQIIYREIAEVIPCP